VRHGKRRPVNSISPANGQAAGADHLRALGRIGLGSRLRRLSERLMGDVARVYKAQGIDFNPTWFPLFTLIARLPDGGGITVVEAARQLQLTHGAVSQFAKELTANRLIRPRADAADARRRTLHLGPRGETLRDRLRPLWRALDLAVKEFLTEARVDLLDEITRIEDALDRESSESRILRHLAGRQRESDAHVTIVSYRPRFRRDFERLNLEWIRRHFWIEPDDKRVLADPKGHILARGGEVLFALLDGKVIGTCALKKWTPARYELAKMAVDPTTRGRGIGAQILRASIERARTLGASELVLETHSSLQAAIHLYRRFGFEDMPLAKETAHGRTDTMMRLRLA
jgi:ribosomal protein S18 acetylase RimI-like enzyme